jgi:ribosomal protein S6--L-glutamate ligase
MKIAILSRKRELYSTRRLVEAAERNGHEARVVDPLRCYMSIVSGRPSIHYRGEDLADIQAIVPRIGASITFYGTAVVRQFEMMGVYCLNDSQSISRSRDKLRSMQLLAREGVGLPTTGIAHSPDDKEDLMSLVGRPPMVVKLLEGTQGMGVVLAETTKACESVIDAFRRLRAYFLRRNSSTRPPAPIFAALSLATPSSRACSERRKKANFAPTSIAAGERRWPRFRPRSAPSRSWRQKPWA